MAETTGRKGFSRHDLLLGMEQKITRRDFLNAVLLGAGAALLDLPAPLHGAAQTDQWDGYGGVGDYAASHGNTAEIVRTAHGVREGLYDAPMPDVADTGEIFDLVVVGGGLSGLGAAFSFKQDTGSKGKCLVVENHPVFGGEAKRNEFVVDGRRYSGPQGSNSFVVPEPGTEGSEIYSELGVPRSFTYQRVPAGAASLSFDRTNFGFMLWHDSAVSTGYFWSGRTGEAGQGWYRDIWRHGLENSPLSRRVRQDLLAWRSGRQKAGERKDFERWLDTMTYKEYLEEVMGLSPEVTRYADPILASSIGLGCDAISAYGARQVGMPGFGEGKGRGGSGTGEWHSFPGGNDGFSRYLIKRLVPDALKGKDTFEDILNREIHFAALDRAGSRVRIRLRATAVRVEHDSVPDASKYVWVTYVKEGKAYRLKARGVVMASGSWMTRRIVKDLPAAYREAYGSFHRSPVLVVNVALARWGFLHKLGVTACRWFDGFGFSCNIRQPMAVGGPVPPPTPDRPAVLTFYVPFYYPGLSVREQGVRGRREMLSTRYSDYERMVRAQMILLFGGTGFDPKADIAGIVLNRWGHAYVNPQPGFYFGGEGSPAPRTVVRRRFGRIAFGHSEHNGHQHWIGAVAEGRRAARQVMEILE
ncbi:MAG: NAD(P)-binding protein [Alphaproteobacteria bacterium]|uniref:NAD(P)-binding protein n=1 Tax=Candidatus Nitrobium versatile TaxID=2884831 RepID=A0A953LYV5_9BACT|nr:NAD(P)-binding protein [Candidatus Nitrobium versatile]